MGDVKMPVQKIEKTALTCTLSLVENGVEEDGTSYLRQADMDSDPTRVHPGCHFL